ncbi:MAG: DbpA RNA binding domain-containing protein [Longimicrobiales bacterium]
MDSFEEVDVTPELTEALAAEGIERPTPLQQTVIPILRKGNNLVLAAGPGSGLLVAWAVPLLERTDPNEPGARVLALTASTESADQLAEALAQLASVTGHTVAALGTPWLLPERAQIVLGTPAEVLARVAAGQLDLSLVQALVVDQAQQLERLGALADVERVIDYLPAEVQRVVSAYPVSPGVADFAERHCKRALTLPAPDTQSVPPRGKVRFRVTSEPREGAALQLADELLAAGARHVLFFCRSDDRAADVGDYLTLHGYVAGAPGDVTVPVWLGVDALQSRAAVKAAEDVRVVSFDVPADPDTLDRRHGITTDGVIMVLPREVPHLRTLARRTGYEAIPFPPPVTRELSSIQQLRASLERALENQDGAAYLGVLEPLFERYDPAEVAAAAVALLRDGKPHPTSAQPERAAPATAEAGDTPSWAKLFLSVGERDGLKPGDLVGAITGEAGIDGKQVGKIDIRESHTVVEVHDSVARQVIKAINGTTIKGRAVRADFDRPRRVDKAPRAPRTPRAPRGR